MIVVVRHVVFGFIVNMVGAALEPVLSLDEKRRELSSPIAAGVSVGREGLKNGRPYGTSERICTR